MKQLFGAMESIVSRMQTGIEVNFELINPHNLPNLPPNALHKMVYVRPNAAGFFCIPESYLPTDNAPMVHHLSPLSPLKKFFPLLFYSIYSNPEMPNQQSK
jgi:hypothetical protein